MLGPADIDDILDHAEVRFALIDDNLHRCRSSSGSWMKCRKLRKVELRQTFSEHFTKEGA